jgi:hypothetical protein
VEITCRFVLAFLVYAGANAILVMLAAMLCVYVGPSAAGSGIPEVKAYLNGVDTPNVFSLNTLFVKVSVSTSLSLSLSHCARTSVCLSVSLCTTRLHIHPLSPIHKQQLHLLVLETCKIFFHKEPWPDSPSYTCRPDSGDNQ